MAGLETAAAVIGIADVAIRSILSFYDFVKDIEGAPDEIVRVRSETEALVICLSGLDFLQTTNQDIKDEVERIGIAESVELCGKACTEFEKDLKQWTKSGTQALSSKFKFVRHKAKVARYVAQICAAKGTVTLAVSIATL